MGILRPRLSSIDSSNNVSASSRSTAQKPHKSSMAAAFFSTVGIATRAKNVKKKTSPKKVLKSVQISTPSKLTKATQHGDNSPRERAIDVPVKPQRTNSLSMLADTTTAISALANGQETTEMPPKKPTLCSRSHSLDSSTLNSTAVLTRTNVVGSGNEKNWPIINDIGISNPRQQREIPVQPKRLSAEFEQHLSAIMNRSRALEHEHRHLMASHGRIIQESNRRAEMYVHQIRQLHSQLNELREANYELAECVRNLEHERVRYQHLYHECRNYGREVSELMKGELAKSERRIVDLQTRCNRLVEENTSLKRLCVYLDVQRNRLQSQSSPQNAIQKQRSSGGRKSEDSASTASSEDAGCCAGSQSSRSSLADADSIPMGSDQHINAETKMMSQFLKEAHFEYIENESTQQHTAEESLLQRIRQELQEVESAETIDGLPEKWRSFVSDDDNTKDAQISSGSRKDNGRNAPIENQQDATSIDLIQYIQSLENRIKQLEENGQFSQPMPISIPLSRRRHCTATLPLPNQTKSIASSMRGLVNGDFGPYNVGELESQQQIFSSTLPSFVRTDRGNSTKDMKEKADSALKSSELEGGSKEHSQALAANPKKAFPPFPQILSNIPRSTQHKEDGPQLLSKVSTHRHPRSTLSSNSVSNYQNYDVNHVNQSAQVSDAYGKGMESFRKRGEMFEYLANDDFINSQTTLLVLGNETELEDPVRMLEVHQLDPIQETEEQHNSEAGTMMRASGTGNAGKNSKIGNAENFAESRTIADDSNNELQVDDKRLSNLSNENDDSLIDFSSTRSCVGYESLDEQLTFQTNGMDGEVISLDDPLQDLPPRMPLFRNNRSPFSPCSTTAVVDNADALYAPILKRPPSNVPNQATKVINTSFRRRHPPSMFASCISGDYAEPDDPTFYAVPNDNDAANNDELNYEANNKPQKGHSYKQTNFPIFQMPPQTTDNEIKINSFSSHLPLPIQPSRIAVGSTRRRPDHSPATRIRVPPPIISQNRQGSNDSSRKKSNASMNASVMNDAVRVLQIHEQIRPRNDNHSFDYVRANAEPNTGRDHFSNSGSADSDGTMNTQQTALLQQICQVTWNSLDRRCTNREANGNGSPYNHRHSLAGPLLKETEGFVQITEL